MKRIFIAVGSESLKGVMALVQRLCEENLFTQFEDRYIAIDSMASEVATFNALAERLHTDRVKGFTVNISTEDETIKKSFQPGWSAHDIPAGGVGGDRTISAKAVEFIQTIWNNPGLQLGMALKPTDQIVIVGSAFGGTSGGLFINVCDFIDLQIRRKRDADKEYRNIQVLGFLLMPEAIPTANNYPIALNMISMFKDLQTTSWRRRLESERPGFKVPVWAQREQNRFPLFTQTTPDAHLLVERGVQGSSLPVGTLYIVPTPTAGRSYTTSILAEQLFAASYLRIDEGHGRWIDRLHQGTSGPAFDITQEDPCFAGFNMFVMKSGRMISLKNWFYKSLIGVLLGEGGRSGLLNGSDVHPIIPGNIKEVFVMAQLPRRDEALVGVEPEQCGALNALLEAEHDAITNPRALHNFQLEFKNFLDALKDAVPPYSIVPAKELITILSATKFSDWNREVNINLINKGYREFHAEVESQSSNITVYKDQLLAALKNALKYVQLRVKQRVVRNWAFGLAQEDAVFQEIAQAFDQKFKLLLRNYIYACRCAHSPFIGVAAFEKETRDFRTVCEQLKDKLEKKCADLRGEQNPFIVEGKLVEPLDQLPDTEAKKLAFNPLKIVLSVVYRSCVSDSALNQTTIRDLQRFGDDAAYLEQVDLTSDGVLTMAEERIVNKYLEIASNLEPGVNPLSEATLVNFSSVKTMTHAKEFKLKDSLDYHYHFVVKQGGVPADFRMSNSDVQGSGQGALGLTTMPNTENGADAFLSQNHRLGMQNMNFWKDETTEVSKIFAGSKVEAEQLLVQGLWIGTLGIDFKAHDILERLYASVAMVRQDWTRAGLQAMVPRSTITLVEMIRFGTVMEALESCVNKKWSEHKRKTGREAETVLLQEDSIKISFEKDGRVFTLADGRLRDFGYIDNPDGTIQLATISVEWVGKILGWIRDPSASGFASFYPSSGLASVRNCETDIFASLRFSIKKEELCEIEALKDAIASTVTITGL